MKIKGASAGDPNFGREIEAKGNQDDDVDATRASDGEFFSQLLSHRERGGNWRNAAHRIIGVERIEGTPPVSAARRFTAELLGTGLLSATVIVSASIADRLSGGPNALALLCSTLAMGGAFLVLMTILGPVSGGHLNPCITMSSAIRHQLSPSLALLYVVAQLCSAIIGAGAAFVMLDPYTLHDAVLGNVARLPYLSEFLASFGLVFTVVGARQWRPSAMPAITAAYLMAVFWFTASLNFANPAIAIARWLTNTTSNGLLEISLIIMAQLLGAFVATLVGVWLFLNNKPKLARSSF